MRFARSTGFWEGGWLLGPALLGALIFIKTADPGSSSPGKKEIMNTNTVISVVAVCVTNWIGYVNDGQQLGLLRTNLVAQIKYDGELHEVLLNSCEGSGYVWRSSDEAWPLDVSVTNAYIWYVPPETSKKMLEEIPSAYKGEGRVYDHFFLLHKDSESVELSLVGQSNSSFINNVIDGTSSGHAPFAIQSAGRRSYLSATNRYSSSPGE